MDNRSFGQPPFGYKTFDEWVTIVRPTEEERNLVGAVRYEVITFLHQCSALQVKEVRAVGSTAKGTACRGKLDVDLAIVLNRFSPQFINNYTELLIEILEPKYGKVVHFVNPESVRVTVRDVQVDLRITTIDDPEFEQTEFVKSVDSLCKDVIRIAKDWRNRVEWCPQRYYCKPSSFLIELLVIATSQNITSSPTHGELFAKFLQLASEPNQWNVTWDWNVKKVFYGPFVLDPAVEHNNVAERQCCKSHIERATLKTLKDMEPQRVKNHYFAQASEHYEAFTYVQTSPKQVEAPSSFLQTILDNPGKSLAVVAGAAVLYKAYAQEKKKNQKTTDQNEECMLM